MKIAVINFSGNVGKTTVARHLLLPRMPGAKLVFIETLNAGSDQARTLKGRQFRELQKYMQTVEDVVVDIGASNVDEVLTLMNRYKHSQADFDYYLVPVVPTPKQQQDTIATIIDLVQLGVTPDRIRVIFNMHEDGTDLSEAFGMLIEYLEEQPIATFDANCRIGVNELYQLVKGSLVDLATLAADKTDYTAQILKTSSMVEKLALADKLVNCRLAAGVVPELDACFAALRLEPAVSAPT